MDLTRSCFSSERFVPQKDGTFKKVRGQYFFVPEGTPFQNRTKLGIHTWEGTPYQTGPWATVPGSVHWVNGAAPPSPPFPQALKCDPCSIIKDAIVSGGQCDLKPLGTSTVTKEPMEVLAPGPLLVLAFTTPNGLAQNLFEIDRDICHTVWQAWPTHLATAGGTPLLVNPPPIKDYLCSWHIPATFAWLPNFTDPVCEVTVHVAGKRPQLLHTLALPEVP